jgi:hypothetical protein
MPSLDDEHATLYRQDPFAGQHGKAAPLLERVFAPLLDRLSIEAGSLSKKDIVNRTQALRRESPAHEGTYVRGAAHLKGKVYRELNKQYKDSANIGINSHQIVPGIAPVSRYNKFLWSDTNAISPMFRVTMSPITEYGSAFAEKMLRTTQILIHLAREKLGGLSTLAYERNQNLLTVETARTMEAEREHKGPQGPSQTVEEGIITFNQLLGLFLAKKIGGFKTGEDALKAFIFHGAPQLGLTTALTARLTLGMTGPMTLSGLHFDPALRMTDRGMDITPETSAFLKRKKDEKRKYRSGVCPMSLVNGRSQTALQTLAETYWKVFSLIP